MSYCRWSSDNWKCDIYAYESCSGYVIHIAGNRHVGDCPEADLLQEDSKKGLREYRKQMKFLESCERKPIQLLHAGESFTLNTLEEFRDKLIELKEIGYYIPDYVFEIIKSEVQDQEGK